MRNPSSTAKGRRQRIEKLARREAEEGLFNTVVLLHVKGPERALLSDAMHGKSPYRAQAKHALNEKLKQYIADALVEQEAVAATSEVNGGFIRDQLHYTEEDYRALNALFFHALQEVKEAPAVQQYFDQHQRTFSPLRAIEPDILAEMSYTEKRYAEDNEHTPYRFQEPVNLYRNRQLLGQPDRMAEILEKRSRAITHAEQYEIRASKMNDTGPTR